MPGWPLKSSKRSSVLVAKRKGRAEEQDEAERLEERLDERLTRAEMEQWEMEWGGLGADTSSVAALLASTLAESGGLDPPAALGIYERKRASSLPPKRFDGGVFSNLESGPMDRSQRRRPKSTTLDNLTNAGIAASPPLQDLGDTSAEEIVFESESGVEGVQDSYFPESAYWDGKNPHETTPPLGAEVFDSSQSSSELEPSDGEVVVKSWALNAEPVGSSPQIAYVPVERPRSMILDVLSNPAVSGNGTLEAYLDGNDFGPITQRPHAGRRSSAPVILPPRKNLHTIPSEDGHGEINGDESDADDGFGIVDPAELPNHLRLKRAFAGYSIPKPLPVPDQYALGSEMNPKSRPALRPSSTDFAGSVERPLSDEPRRHSSMGFHRRDKSSTPTENFRKDVARIFAGEEDDQDDSVPLAVAHAATLSRPHSMAFGASMPNLGPVSFAPLHASLPHRPSLRPASSAFGLSVASLPMMGDPRQHSSIGFHYPFHRVDPEEEYRREAERILNANLAWKAPAPKVDKSSVSNPFFLPPERLNHRLEAEKLLEGVQKIKHQPKIDPATITNEHFLGGPQKPTPGYRPPRSRAVSAFPSSNRPRPTSLAFPTTMADEQIRQSLRPPTSHTLRPSASYESLSVKYNPNRNTLINLAGSLGENADRGTHERPARYQREHPQKEERIIVADQTWTSPKRRTMMSQMSQAAPKVMDMSQLEDRHQRHLKRMQAPVIAAVKSSAETAEAKQLFAKRRENEAALFREQERAREAATRRSRRSSIGNLTILLNKPNEPPSTPSSLSPNSPTEFAHMKRMSATRSVSSPSFGAPPTSTVDFPRRPEPVAPMGGSRRGSVMSIQKVAQWKDGGYTPSRKELVPSPRQMVHSPNELPASPKPKNKLDWLGY
ncbi:hypothetical protein P7C70_g3863, partial [Phenoliferia sp. Uapishka_3]